MKTPLYLCIAVLTILQVRAQDKDIIPFEPDKEYTQQFLDSVLDNVIRVKTTDLKKMLESNPNLLGWPHYYNRSAIINYHDGNTDSTLYYVDKAVSSFNNSSVKRDLDEEPLVNAYYYKGKAYWKLKDYDASTKNYHLALDLHKKHPYKWVSYIYSGIGWNHFENGDDSLALTYYHRAINDANFKKIDRAMITTQKSMGDIYSRHQQMDSALYFYNNALARSQSSSYKANISAIYTSLGFSYYDLKKLDSTVYYFEKAYATNLEQGIPSYEGAEINHHLVKGVHEYHHNLLGNALKSLQQCIGLIASQSSLTKSDERCAVLAFDFLNRIYQLQGNQKGQQQNFEASLSYFRDYSKDLLKEQTRKLEVAYQTREKDASILQLEQNKKQQETIIRQQRFLFAGYAALSLVLLGLGYVLFRQRKLKAQFEKLNLEQRLLTTQMNPHFIGNAMNHVSALVQAKKSTAVPYLQKLSSLFRTVLQHSREEFVGLDEEVGALETYLELQSNFHHTFDYRITIDKNIETEACIIPPLLIQPFVENSIVHGFKGISHKGAIEIHLEQVDKGLLCCTIRDNGQANTTKGKSSHQSVSTQVIKEQLAIFRKKYKVDSRFTMETTSDGTIVRLYLPYLLDT